MVLNIAFVKKRGLKLNITLKSWQEGGPDWPEAKDSLELGTHDRSYFINRFLQFFCLNYFIFIILKLFLVVFRPF